MVKYEITEKGRVTDNAFIERLWRNIKYEKIYLNPPKDGLELYMLINDYFNYYNNERRHQAIEHEQPFNRYKMVA